MATKKAWPQTVQIGSAKIGPEYPTYVVAEAGVNHNGDLSLAMDLVRAAAAAGADAVKFQAFSARRLVTADADAASYQQAHRQRDMLEKLELHPEDFAAIASQCAAEQIELLITPFSVEDVALVVGLGVRAIKVASPDVVHLPLLTAIGQTQLPVLMSTGAAEMDEIATAVDTLAAAGTKELVLLHCVSSYPAPLREAHLRCIASLADAFGVPAGYSDHTTEIFVGEMAVTVGACLLEKHFTLDPTMDGPDHAFSLRPVELTAYIARARAAKRGQFDPDAVDPDHLAALGNGVKTSRSIESDVRQIARTSVTAAVDISAGTTLTAQMLTVKRPSGGIPPGQLDSLPGRVAAVDIAADTTITADMLK